MPGRLLTERVEGFGAALLVPNSEPVFERSPPPLRCEDVEDLCIFSLGFPRTVMQSSDKGGLWASRADGKAWLPDCLITCSLMPLK